MNDSKLRIGIAGYGVVGKRRHHFIDRHEHFQTVAVCDRKFGGDEPVPPGLQAFESYQDLLAIDLDVLFVCLTNDLAAQVTEAGLRKGLHVFCEKPPSRTVEDVLKVQACLRECPGQKLKYGFNHRYHESVVDALALVKSGQLGSIINLRGIYGKSTIINFDSDWRTKRSIAGGGILLDQGIHMVDLLRLFAGEFKEYRSFISNGHWRHDVEDNAFALLQTEGGVVAMLHSSATQWRHQFNLEIALTDGSINLSGILSGSKSYGEETMTIIKRPQETGALPREEIRRYLNDPSWAAEVEEFSEAIRLDKPVQNGSIDDAIQTMETVFQIYRADPVWKKQWGL